MSLDLYTFLESLPDRQSWQSAIDQTGYNLKLDPDLDVAHDEGFVPCLIVGKSSGFELYATPASEVLRDYLSLKSAVGARSHALCFRWGGDLAECACVMGASLALVRRFGAVAYYPPDDLVYDAEGLEEDLRECIADI
jgi:hypothetical protein